MGFKYRLIVRKRLLSAEPAVAPRKLNMSLRRADARPSRLEAESPHGLVLVLILGCPQRRPLLNSDGREV